MLRREFVRVLATLRKPETVPKMLEVKVVALDKAERFRMKSLKKDVKSAQENSERSMIRRSSVRAYVRHGRVILMPFANHVCEE